MKKLLYLGLTLAALVFSSFGVYKTYRIPPLDQGSNQVPVLRAASAECAKNWEWSENQVLVLTANPNFLTAKLNEEEITVELLRDILRDVLATRMDRSLFLVDNSAGDDYASLLLERRLEQLPRLDRICVIDPKHPPAWYPPKPYRSGGFGGGGLWRSALLKKGLF
jgi:hypothetical protein